MRLLMRSLCVWIVFVAMAAGVSLRAAQAPTSADAMLDEARQLFEALEYEQAVPALDRAIAALEPIAAEAGPDRASLARAFEMRGRARFGLNDAEGAAADFQSLLRLEPAFSFDAQVSPRVVALLDTVRKTTIGELRLTVEPSDAAVELDGRPVTSTAEPLSLAAGEFTLTVQRVGYRPLEQQVIVPAGATTDVPVSLERTAAAVFLASIPAGAEVVVDGVSRGRTGPGPLVLTDLAAGTYVVRFRADCRVSEVRQLVIEELADYRMEPVTLRAAVAPVTVNSSPAGASVSLDGRQQGTTPVTLPEVCEGRRTLLVRGEQGRFSRDITVTTGEALSIEGTLKPAFALLPSGDLPAGAPDPRLVVERALGTADHVALYVPSAEELEAAVDGEPLPPDWLAFDASRRPIAGASAMSVTARRELSARLSKGLDVQGVAAVVQPSASSSEFVLTLLAAGAGQPDVVPVDPERADSVAEAVQRFSHVPPFVRRGIGAALLEVADGDAVRLVVVAVDAETAAAPSGLAVGERLTAVNGREVSSAADFERVLHDDPPEGEVTVAVTDRSGSNRSIRVATIASPRLVSVEDQSLLFNPLAVALRSRLAAADPSEHPFLRLNLAVALMRLGDPQAAREELNAVQLPPGPGISRGTQQYLLGLAYEGLGDMVAAAQAWRAAAEAGGSLTEDGPAIEDVAGAKLNN